MISIKNICLLAIHFTMMFSFLRNNVLCGNSCFSTNKTPRPDEGLYKRSSSHKSTPTRHQLPQPKPFIPLSFPMVRSLTFPRSRSTTKSIAKSQSLQSTKPTSRPQFTHATKSITRLQSLRSHPGTVPERELTNIDLRPLAPATDVPTSGPLSPLSPYKNRPTNVRRGIGPHTAPIVRFNRPIHLQPIRTAHRRKKSSPMTSPRPLERLPSIKEQEH